MVTPVTDEKMDDRYSTLQLSHSTHTHWLNGGEQWEHVGIHRQKKLEGRSCGSPPFTMAFHQGNKIHPNTTPPSSPSSHHLQTHTYQFPHHLTHKVHHWVPLTDRCRKEEHPNKLNTPHTVTHSRLAELLVVSEMYTFSLRGQVRHSGFRRSKKNNNPKTSIRCTWNHIQ